MESKPQCKQHDERGVKKIHRMHLVKRMNYSYSISGLNNLAMILILLSATKLECACGFISSARFEFSGSMYHKTSSYAKTRKLTQDVCDRHGVFSRLQTERNPLLAPGKNLKETLHDHDGKTSISTLDKPSPSSSTSSSLNNESEHEIFEGRGRRGGAMGAQLVAKEGKANTRQLKRRKRSVEPFQKRKHKGRSRNMASLKHQINFLPWFTSYRVSKQTQSKLQQAARYTPSSFDDKTPNVRYIRIATRILEVLLVETPSTNCNDVNVMYALNLCAKTLSKARLHLDNDTTENRRSNDKDLYKNTHHNNKRQQQVDTTTTIKLFQLLAQLMEVVSEHMLHSQRLSFRQKANAAWSTANILLFLREISNFNILSPSSLLQKLQTDNAATTGGREVERSPKEITDNRNSSEILSKATDEIKYQLKQFLIDVGTSINDDIIQRERYDQELETNTYAGEFQIPIQPGELSMVLWSYATVWTTTINSSSSYLLSSPLVTATRHNNDIVFSVEPLNKSLRQDDNKLHRYNNNEYSATDRDSVVEKNNKLDKSIERCAIKLHYNIANFIIVNKRKEQQNRNSTSSPILQGARWNELANMAWSFATIGAHFDVNDLELKVSSSDDLDSNIPQGQGENNRTISSCDKDEYLATIANFLSFLSEEATARLQFSDGTNSGDEKDSSLFASSKSKSNSLPDSFPLPRDISTIAWSLGSMTTQCPLWYFQLGDDLQRLAYPVARYELHLTSEPFRHWKPKDLVQLGVGLAHAAVADDVDGDEEIKNGTKLIPNLLKGLFETATQQIDKFQTWELTILLWAQARLHLTRKMDSSYGNFVDKAVDSLWHRVVSSKEATSTSSALLLPPQEQANLAWSLVLLEEYHNDKAKELLQHVFRKAAQSSWSTTLSNAVAMIAKRAPRDDKTNIMLPEHAHQLWQVLVLLRSEAPSVLQSVDEVEPGSPFAELLQQCWLEEKARPKLSSYSHKKLSETLSNMRVAHLNEHDEDIDVAIVLKDANNKNKGSWTALSSTSVISDEDSSFDRANDLTSPKSSLRNKVAVEYDGPTHFVRGGRRPLGHTVLKYRLLKQQGWIVVRVPHYEFDKIPMWATMERQRYLQRLLKTHPQLTFSDVDTSTYKVLIPNRTSRFD